MHPWISKSARASDTVHVRGETSSIYDEAVQVKWGDGPIDFTMKECYCSAHIPPIKVLLLARGKQDPQKDKLFTVRGEGQKDTNRSWDPWCARHRLDTSRTVTK